jgi:hypothetical protein
LKYFAGFYTEVVAIFPFKLQPLTLTKFGCH